MGRTVLLSGKPGVGKTTLIRKLLPTLPGSCGGFYTQEIRQRGQRVGFEIITLDGQRTILAHIDRPGPPRVSKYGVYVQNVDTVAVPALYQAIAEADYVIIDEIGKMELFSSSFRTAVLQAIQSPKPVLGTVMLRTHPWTNALKSMPEVTVVSVTMANRDHLLERIRQLLVS